MFFFLRALFFPSFPGRKELLRFRFCSKEEDKRNSSFVFAFAVAFACSLEGEIMVSFFARYARSKDNN